MSQLTIIAKIKTNLGAEEQVHQKLIRLVGLTRTEEGCIEYTLHRSIEDPSVFLFYENWANKSLWQKHMQSQDFLAFGKNTEMWIESLGLYQLAKEPE